MKKSNPVDLEKNKLLKEIEELEREIEDIKKRIFRILSSMMSFNYWRKKNENLKLKRISFGQWEFKS
jgi:predicted  nucleic acid-binding Zn-ribbon protein